LINCIPCSGQDGFFKNEPTFGGQLSQKDFRHEGHLQAFACKKPPTFFPHIVQIAAGIEFVKK